VRKRIRLGGLLCLVLAASGLACGSDERKPLNILLISVDTLRPDHLGYGGSPRPVSPNIDRLAREGVVFTRACSQSGWTLPSMATILTGRYPADHKAVDFNYGLDRNLPTLAGILKQRGYDTRGYVSHVLLSEKYGMDRGFARFDASVLDRGDPHAISTSRELCELAVKDLRDLRQPFFVWVHFFDPHFAYLPHDEWAAFGNANVDRYDQEIAYTDRYVGSLLAALEERGRLRNTLVVFTADHGEEFGDHGGEYHETCFQEVLSVPLLIRAPGLAAGTDTSWTDQIDLLPTILGRLGVPPPPDCPGRNLLGGSAPPHPIFVERERPPGFRQRAILWQGQKLVRVETRDIALIAPESRTEYAAPKNVVAGTWAYDLRRDPAERRNTFSLDDPTSVKLLAALAAHFTGYRLPAQDVVVDEALRERLRSLGYIR